MIALYLVLVGIYGLIKLAPDTTDQVLVRNAFLGILVSSGLRHYYYDGFIWKVRERGTREGLGLSGGRAEELSARLPRWVRHTAYWMLMIVPTAYLAFAYVRGTVDPVTQAGNIVEIWPDDPDAHVALAFELLRSGNMHAAIQEYEPALRIDPEHREARLRLLELRGFIDTLKSPGGG